MLVQHVVPAHLAARQYVVLAAVDQIQRDTRRLHHRRTRPTQVVWSPGAIPAAGQHRAFFAALALHYSDIRNGHHRPHICLLYNLHQADILYACTVLLVDAMKIRVVKMRSAGVAVERRMLNDRYTVKHHGLLVIMDVTDQGLRRPVKVARLAQPGRPGPYMELFDPHIVWANEGKFTLAGFERTTNAEGQVTEFAQSWLCALDLALAEPAIDAVGGRPARS